MNLFDVYQEMNKDKGLFAEGHTGTKLDMDRARSTFETLSKSKEDGGLGLDLTKDIGSQIDKVSTTKTTKHLSIKCNVFYHKVTKRT